MRYLDLPKEQLILELETARQKNDQLQSEIENHLKRRLRYEKMVADISTFAVGTEDPSLFQQNCLQIVGETSHLSRTYIFEHRHESDTMDNTFEWFAPGISPQKEHLQGIRAKDVPWWMEMMRGNQIINCKDIEELPHEAERSILRDQEIKSVLVVPLFVKKEYFGFMGFDECRYQREWPPEDVALLKTISEIIGMVLQREQDRRVLVEKEALLSATIDSLPFDLFVLGKDNRYTIINSTARRWGEAVGKRPEEVVKDLGVLDRWLENNRRAFSGETVREEAQYKINGNTECYYNVISPVRIDHEVNAIVGINIDITDRKLAEEELRNSEEKYRDLFNNALVGIYRTNVTDGKVIDANFRMARMLGYDDLNEFIKEFIFSEHYVDPGTRKKLMEELMQKEEVSGFEARFSRRDGKIIWSRFSSRIVHEKGYLEGVAIDVTNEKEALSKLVDSETKYRLLVENANDAVFVVRDGKIDFPNPMARKMAGEMGLDLDKKPFYEYIHPEDRAMVMERHRRRLQGEMLPSVYSFRLINDGGEQRWVELNTSVMNWEGRPSTLNFLRDITVQKTLEAELQQARRMESIGTLAGGIAHDFNNLLMGIQGRVSLMLMKADTSDPDYRDLKDIEEIVKSGADLTKQLLGFSRGGRYEVKPTDLNQLIRQTLELFSRTKKHIRIRRRFQSDLWPAEIDRGQLEQVLLNLFLNAAEAMPNTGTLSVHTTNRLLDEAFAKPHSVPSGRFVLISVTDTGIGMDEETLRRVFEPFFTTKGRGRGTGLGLASVYGIIRNHGGIVVASSKVGFGTVFDVYLPASEKTVSPEYTPSSEALLKGTETVLLVDDEAKVLDICERFLKTLGYSVLTARSGREALQTYERNKADIAIVVLDMIMPGMSGRETFDAFMRMDPSLKILVSSGYTVEGDVSDLMSRGCKGYIQKPFSIRLLAKEIRRFLDEN